MSARVERTIPARTSRTEPVVLNFNAEQLKAPFSLRCGAILIDYIVLILVPVVSLLLVRIFYPDYDGNRFLNSNISNMGWLITVLVSLTNLIILPVIGGQSLGKMLTGLRIVKIDGHSAPLTSLIFRHLIGYPLTILTLGLGFILSVLNKKGRALHDFLAGTVVVYGYKQIVKKTEE